MKFAWLLLLTISACGDSPILNHDDEPSSFIRSGFEAQTETYEFKKIAYSFSIDWQTGPSTDVSSFILKTWKTDTGTVNGPYLDLPNTLKVILWMPSMGHGSAPVKITKMGPGEYKVTNIYFVMPGRWDVKFHVTKANDVLDEVNLPFDI